MCKDASVCDDALKGLEYISQAAGTPVEYTQGGGGNTSAKLDDRLMAVKASGFQLKQVNQREGYVVVNFKNIKSYYENIDINLDKDYERESSEIMKGCIVETEGRKKLRPSVEAGFHSILKKYVIHTHSVYANILCCTENAGAKVEQVFKGKEYETAFIPYIRPGFYLAVKIDEVIKNKEKDCGRFPEVIFMENHGLVVTSDDSRKCAELHREVNDCIKEYLGIKEPFPAIELTRADDDTIAGKTRYLTEYFKDSGITARFFDENVLYPDQLVYLNGNISVDRMDSKLNINSSSGERIYKASLMEAGTMEETLLAYIYVVDNIRKSGFSLKTMPKEEIGFILNWEGEAYRKSIITGKA
jgi:ribulose-5-phosphate 4-epimerase/fuculose-1-phosphate aldolase